jgi:hypothetical protein
MPRPPTEVSRGLNSKDFFFLSASRSLASFFVYLHSVPRAQVHTVVARASSRETYACYRWYLLWHACNAPPPLNLHWYVKPLEHLTPSLKWWKPLQNYHRPVLKHRVDNCLETFWNHLFTNLFITYDFEGLRLTEKQKSDHYHSMRRPLHDASIYWLCRCLPTMAVYNAIVFWSLAFDKFRIYFFNYPLLHF